MLMQAIGGLAQSRTAAVLDVNRTAGIHHLLRGKRKNGSHHTKTSESPFLTGKSEKSFQAGASLWRAGEMHSSQSSTSAATPGQQGERQKQQGAKSATAVTATLGLRCRLGGDGYRDGFVDTRAAFVIARAGQDERVVTHQGQRADRNRTAAARLVPRPEAPVVSTGPP